MIVTHLLGGLGNQLFQYSAGRALAIRHGTSLRLDTRSLGRNTLRRYALEHFAIHAEELSWSDCAKLGLPTDDESRIVRFAARFMGQPKLRVVRERGFEFDPSVMSAPDDCFLKGYWQSPKYFLDIDHTIREDLSIRVPLAGKNLELARHIEDCVAVSLHVRRGDYVTSAKTHRYHGVCTAEYYSAAESLLLTRLGDYRLFVFSDDPGWAEGELHHPVPAFVVGHNGPERDYEDMRLMSLCKHHIIANSTFSWWGAWLCQNPGKIVIAPQNWFRQATHSTRDLIPNNWIRL